MSSEGDDRDARMDASKSEVGRLVARSRTGEDARHIAIGW